MRKTKQCEKCAALDEMMREIRALRDEVARLRAPAPVFVPVITAPAPYYPTYPFPQWTIPHYEITCAGRAPVDTGTTITLSYGGVSQ